MNYTILKKYMPQGIKHQGHKFIRTYINPIRAKGKTKIFGIGRNKTGTSSMQQAFYELGFPVGHQNKAEALLPYYKKGDFDKIINYCKTAQVFFDFPFSYPETFKHLDKAYPNSKFILTLRNSPEQWYQSKINYDIKRFGKNALPTKEDLQNATHIWKGWVWEAHQLMFGTPEDDLYNKERLIETYNKHNQSIMDYFKNRPDDLLVINVAKEGDFKRLLDFLDIQSNRSDFPLANQTKSL